MVAAVLGLAGGELLTPTIVLLHGVGLELAGSLSLLPVLVVLMLLSAVEVRGHR